MDYEVKLLKPAQLDLESQVRFRLQHSHEHASYFANEVIEAVSSLQNHPFRGKPLTRLGPNYRVKLIVPYLHIVYRIFEDRLLVEVCAIVDSRQDFNRAWNSRRRR